MRDLVVATIADQPDIEIVGELRNEDELAEAVEDSQPNVLILTLDYAEKRADQCGFLLGQHPQLRILALAPEHNLATVYWAIIDVRSRVMESSQAGILSALRQRSCFDLAPAK